MKNYIPRRLREVVIARAHHCCEYCLLHEEDGYYAFHIDHIIPILHSGKTTSENLAYACPVCNRLKGSNFNTILPGGVQSRLYNPRLDIWVDHFLLVGPIIEPLTNVGEATLHLLRLNDAQRILERKALIEVNRYPIL